jgi:deoxyadenosine/deoxycytidine kinase
MQQFETQTVDTQTVEMQTINVQPIVISVDGIIGAGKTNLCELLENKLPSVLPELDEQFQNPNICVVYEPVEIWKSTGALGRFYGDVRGRAYEFQSFVYATRVQSVCNTITEHTAKTGRPADIYILERSVFSDEYLFVDMLHKEGTFDDIQLTMYRTWCRMWDKLLPWHPSGFIYLAPTIDATMSRIAIRARAGETVSKTYQEALLSQHEQVFGGSTITLETSAGTICRPILHIRTDDDFRLKNGGHVEIVQQVAQFIKSLAKVSDKK